MKAAQILVLLCANIASAARCRPSAPASSSASAGSGAGAGAGASSSSTVPSSTPASVVSTVVPPVSTIPSSVLSSSSFGSSGSLSASLTSSVSSASAASVTPASSSSSSVPAPSASCGVTNLFGSAANIATSGAAWNPQGSAAFFADSCETTTDQCLEVQGTSTTANTFAFGYFLPTTAGTAYTLTFDFAVLSGAVSSPITCTIAGGTVVNVTPVLTSGAGVYKVETAQFTGSATGTTTNFFCSGSSTTAFEVAFNNFFFTNAC
ncbi:hypothetical protein SCUCBS95973_001220 [Sporothrix curviconia]|uniref:Uncharacterized protein n=1 Tax=Sporothrix curviconia TaxID=1260050 RepID=A0ABP0AWT6_9PEZI